DTHADLGRRPAGQPGGEHAGRGDRPRVSHPSGAGFAGPGPSRRFCDWRHRSDDRRKDRQGVARPRRSRLAGRPARRRCDQAPGKRRAAGAVSISRQGHHGPGGPRRRGRGATLGRHADRARRLAHLAGRPPCPAQRRGRKSYHLCGLGLDPHHPPTRQAHHPERRGPRGHGIREGNDVSTVGTTAADPAAPASDLPVPPDIAPEKTVSAGQWGMVAFLISEVALFGTLIATYLSFLGKDTIGPTPAEALKLGLVVCTTICLLASSVTIHLAERALRAGGEAAFRGWWALTIALGVAFLGGTAYEWYG